MTQQLEQAITLAQSLSITEQLELLKTLSSIIQQSHSREISPASDTDFSGESFRRSWQQAVTGQTLPLSQLWEDSEDD